MNTEKPATPPASTKADKPSAKPQKPAEKTRVKPKPAPKPKKEGGFRTTGLVIVAGFSVMAALAGGAIGAYAAKHFDEQSKTGAITQSQLSSAMDKAQKDRAALESELNEVKAENNRLRSDVSSLEARLFTLEQMPKEPPTARDALTEVDTTPQSEMPTASSRVTISEMVRQGEGEAEPDNADLPQDINLPATETTVEDLPETQSDNIEMTPPTSQGEPTAQVEPAKPSRVDIIESFPKAKMMAAIETPKDEDVGYIRALWRKHVQSGNDVATRDRAAITAAEQALGRENIADALTALDKASPAVRSAGADWIADANAYLNTP